MLRPATSGTGPPCRGCDGQGKVPVEIKGGNGQTAVVHRDCPACRGTGRQGYVCK